GDQDERGEARVDQQMTPELLLALGPRWRHGLHDPGHRLASRRASPSLRGRRTARTTPVTDSPRLAAAARTTPLTDSPRLAAAARTTPLTDSPRLAAAARTTPVTDSPRLAAAARTTPLTDSPRLAAAALARPRSQTRLASRLRLALPFPPLQVPEDEEERGEQQRHQEERDRGAPAEVAGLDADLVREHGQNLARVTGAALGQEVHDAQVGEREDRVEEKPDHQDRKDHRHHHVAEALHEGAAVHLGGIEDLQRHRGEAREEDDRAEREGAPHVDRDTRGQRQMRLAEPDRPVGRAVPADQSRAAQRPVDHAELRVVHPLPGEHTDRDRQCERNHHETADELLSLELLEQEEGERRAQNTLENR